VANRSIVKIEPFVMLAGQIDETLLRRGVIVVVHNINEPPFRKLCIKRHLVVVKSAWTIRNGAEGPIGDEPFRLFLAVDFCPWTCPHVDIRISEFPKVGDFVLPQLELERAFFR
jgi:hypothetical protein